MERPRKVGVWQSVQKRPPTREDRDRWECGSQYNGDHGQVERQVGVWQSTVSTKATTDTGRRTVADRWECGSQYNGDHGQVKRQVGIWGIECRGQRTDRRNGGDAEATTNRRRDGQMGGS